MAKHKIYIPKDEDIDRESISDYYLMSWHYADENSPGFFDFKIKNKVSSLFAACLISLNPQNSFMKSFIDNRQYSVTVVGKPKQKKVEIEVELAEKKKYKAEQFHSMNRKIARDIISKLPSMLESMKNEEGVDMPAIVPISSLGLTSPFDRKERPFWEIITPTTAKITEEQREEGYKAVEESFQQAKITEEQKKEGYKAVETAFQRGEITEGERDELYTMLESGDIKKMPDKFRYLAYLYAITLLLWILSVLLLGYNFYIYSQGKEKFIKELMDNLRKIRIKNKDLSEVVRVTTELRDKLFDDWNKMISNYKKSLKKKNQQIKDIQANCDETCSTLQKIIENMRDDRISLEEKIRFLEENVNL